MSELTKRGLPDLHEPIAGMVSGKGLQLAHGLVLIPMDEQGTSIVDLEEVVINNADVPVRGVTVKGIRVVKTGDRLYIGP